MRVAVALFLFAVVCVSAYTTDEYQSTFISWMKDHVKMYEHTEFLTRFEVFKSNMDYVRDWNARGSSTVLGLNGLADLSNSEYRNIYLGTRVDATAILANAEPYVHSGEPLAVTVDWRTQNAVTGIKDQGQCGSCWSFSTTGSVEGAWAIAKKVNPVPLSEQNLMDCSILQGNLGCNGGLMNRAFTWIINNKGIDTEASYPYQAKLGNCKFSTANIGASISSFTNVAAGDETALASALNKQPISVAIDAGHNSFQLYKTGVYYEPACSSSRLDHGVLAVGYGTDDTTKADYWIVKNSWGTVWGQQGYILMSRNKSNNCGIATQASYPNV